MVIQCCRLNSTVCLGLDDHLAWVAEENFSTKYKIEEMCNMEMVNTVMPSARLWQYECNVWCQTLEATLCKMPPEKNQFFTHYILLARQKPSKVTIVHEGLSWDWEVDMRDISMVLCHSDKTSKHFDLQCSHNAKGTMHFGDTDYLHEKGIQFWHMSEVFWERWCQTLEATLCKIKKIK